MPRPLRIALTLFATASLFIAGSHAQNLSFDVVSIKPYDTHSSPLPPGIGGLVGPYVGGRLEAK
jgi:hypothetical protein